MGELLDIGEKDKIPSFIQEAWEYVAKGFLKRRLSEDNDIFESSDDMLEYI